MKVRRFSSRPKGQGSSFSSSSSCPLSSLSTSSLRPSSSSSSIDSSSLPSYPSPCFPARTRLSLASTFSSRCFRSSRLHAGDGCESTRPRISRYKTPSSGSLRLSCASSASSSSPARPLICQSCLVFSSRPRGSLVGTTHSRPILSSSFVSSNRPERRSPLLDGRKREELPSTPSLSSSSLASLLSLSSSPPPFVSLFSSPHTPTRSSSSSCLSSFCPSFPPALRPFSSSPPPFASPSSSSSTYCPPADGGSSVSSSSRLLSREPRRFRRAVWRLQKHGVLTESFLSLPYVSWRSFLKFLHVLMSKSLSLHGKDLSSIPYVCKKYHLHDFRVIDRVLASAVLAGLSRRFSFSSFSSQEHLLPGLSSSSSEAESLSKKDSDHKSSSDTKPESGTVVFASKPSLFLFVSSLDDWPITNHPYHRHAIQRFLAIVSANLASYTARDLLLLIDALSSSSCREESGRISLLSASPSLSRQSSHAPSTSNGENEHRRGSVIETTSSSSSSSSAEREEQREAEDGRTDCGVPFPRGSVHGSRTPFVSLQRDKGLAYQQHHRQFPVEVLEEVEVTMGLLYIHLEKRLYEELRSRQEEEEDKHQESETDADRSPGEASSLSGIEKTVLNSERYPRLTVTEAYEILTRGLPTCLSSSTSSFFSNQNIRKALLLQECQARENEKQTRQEDKDKSAREPRHHSSQIKDRILQEGEGQLVSQRQAFHSFLHSISSSESVLMTAHGRHDFRHRIDSIRKAGQTNSPQVGHWLADTAKNLLTLVEHEILTSRQSLLSLFSSPSFLYCSPPMVLREVALLIKAASSASSVGALTLGKTSGVCTPADTRESFSSIVESSGSKTQERTDVENRKEQSVDGDVGAQDEEMGIDSPSTETEAYYCRLKFPGPLQLTRDSSGSVCRPEESPNFSDQVLHQLFVRKNLPQSITDSVRVERRGFEKKTLQEIASPNFSSSSTSPCLLLDTLRVDLLRTAARHLPQAHLSRFSHLIWKQLQGVPAYSRRGFAPSGNHSHLSDEAHLCDDSVHTPQERLSIRSPCCSSLPLLVTILPLFARTLCRLLTASASSLFPSSERGEKLNSFFNRPSAFSSPGLLLGKQRQAPNAHEQDKMNQGRKKILSPATQKTGALTAEGGALDTLLASTTETMNVEEEEEGKAGKRRTRENDVQEEKKKQGGRSRREEKKKQKGQGEGARLAEQYCSPVVWFRRVLKILRVTLERQEEWLRRARAAEARGDRSDGEQETARAASSSSSSSLSSRPAGKKTGVASNESIDDVSISFSFSRQTQFSQEKTLIVEAALQHTLESYLSARVYTKLTRLYLQRLRRRRRERSRPTARGSLQADDECPAIDSYRENDACEALSFRKLRFSGTSYTVVSCLHRQLDMCLDISGNHLKEALTCIAGPMLPASALSRLVSQDLSLGTPSSSVGTPGRNVVNKGRSRKERRETAISNQTAIHSDGVSPTGRKGQEGKKRSSRRASGSTDAHVSWSPRVCTFNTSLHAWLVPHIISSCPLHMSALYYHLLVSGLSPEFSGLLLRSRRDGVGRMESSGLLQVSREHEASSGKTRKGDEGTDSHSIEGESRIAQTDATNRSCREASYGRSFYLDSIFRLGNHLLDNLKAIRRGLEQQCRISKEKQEKILISLPQFQRYNSDLILRDEDLDYTKFGQYLNLQEPLCGLSRTREILSHLKIINQHTSRALASLRDEVSVSPFSHLDEKKAREGSTEKEREEGRKEEKSIYEQLEELVSHVAYSARRCLYTTIIQAPAHRKAWRGPCRGEVEWITQQALAMTHADSTKREQMKKKDKTTEVAVEAVEVVDSGTRDVPVAGSSFSDASSGDAERKANPEKAESGSAGPRTFVLKSFFGKSRREGSRAKELEEDDKFIESEELNNRRGDRDNDRVQLRTLLEKVYPDTGPIACDLQSPPRIVRARGFARSERDSVEPSPPGIFRRYAILRGDYPDKRHRRKAQARMFSEDLDETTEDSPEGRESGEASEQETTRKRTHVGDSQDADGRGDSEVAVKKERVMIRRLSSP